MLGGRADVMFEAMPTLVGHLRDGKLRGLGVGSVTRSPVFPDIPSVSEFLPGYEANVWFGIGAPRQTPGDIVERLNREINAGLNDPALQQKITQVGGTPLTGSSAEFEKLFVRDSEKWAKVVQAAAVKTQ
jgi:tripartite-type tricarboxylate transporter receptor subunit TctC